MEVFVGGSASCTAALQGTASREARVLMHTLPSLVLNFSGDDYSTDDGTAPLWSLPPVPATATAALTGKPSLWIEVDPPREADESLILDFVVQDFAYDPGTPKALVSPATAVVDAKAYGTSASSASAQATCMRTAGGSGAVGSVATVIGKAKLSASAFSTSTPYALVQGYGVRTAIANGHVPPSLKLDFITGDYGVGDSTDPWAAEKIVAASEALPEAKCEKTTPALTQAVGAVAHLEAEAFVDNISEGHCTATSSATGSAQVLFAGQGDCVPTMGFAPVTGIRTVRMRRQIAKGTAVLEGTGYIYVLASGRVEARAHCYGTWREVAKGQAVCTATATTGEVLRTRLAKGNTVADPNEPSLVLDFTRDQYDQASELLTGTGALVEGTAHVEFFGAGQVVAQAKVQGAVRHYVAATGLSIVDASGICVATSAAINTLAHSRVVALVRCTATITSDPQLTYAGRGTASCKATVTGYAEKVLKAEGSGVITSEARSTANSKVEAKGAGKASAQVIAIGKAKKHAKAKGKSAGTATVVVLQTGIGVKAPAIGQSSATGRGHRDAYATATIVATVLQLEAKPVCYLNGAGSASGPFAAKATATGYTELVEKIPASGSVMATAQVVGINNVNIDLVAPSERVTSIPGSSRAMEVEYAPRLMNVA